MRTAPGCQKMQRLWVAHSPLAVPHPCCCSLGHSRVRRWQRVDRRVHSLSRGDVEATDTAACACVRPPSCTIPRNTRKCRHPRPRVPGRQLPSKKRLHGQGMCPADIPSSSRTSHPPACTAQTSGTAQTLAEIASQGERHATPGALPTHHTAYPPRGSCLRVQAHHSPRSGGSLQPPALQLP